MRTVVSLFRRPCSLVCGLLFACSTPTIAAAASFDCGKAKTALEKTVCADPKLSAADSEMARRYDKARSMLSDRGKAILRSGQREWLKVIKVLCVDHKRTEGQTECVRRQYEDRLESLQTAAVRVGPFLFSRIDNYASPGLDEATGTPLEQHIGLPRIDSPLSPEAEQWNAAIVRFSEAARANWCYGEFETADPRDSDRLSEQMLTFKVFSRDKFVNARFTHYERCGEGAANEDVNNISFLWGPALHPLSAADVFLRDSDWVSFLVTRAAREFEIDDPDPGTRKDFRDGIKTVVTDPAAWSFTEQGLVISFNPGYGNASVASGPIDVAIPWKDLYPFIRPTAPVPGH